MLSLPVPFDDKEQPKKEKIRKMQVMPVKGKSLSWPDDCKSDACTQGEMGI